MSGERYVVIDGVARTEPMGAEKLASYLVTRTSSGAARLQVRAVPAEGAPVGAAPPSRLGPLGQAIVDGLARQDALHGTRR